MPLWSNAVVLRRMTLGIWFIGAHTDVCGFSIACMASPFHDLPVQLALEFPVPGIWLADVGPFCGRLL